VIAAKTLSVQLVTEIWGNFGNGGARIGNAGENANPLNRGVKWLDRKDYRPEPLSTTDWGLAGSESRICSVAMRGPVMAGLKVIWMVQAAPGIRFWPQSLLWAKSIPEVTMSVIFRVVAPALDNVAVFGGVIEPTGWSPKSKDAGVSLTSAEPVAGRLAVFSWAVAAASDPQIQAAPMIQPSHAFKVRSCEGNEILRVVSLIRRAGNKFAAKASFQQA